MTDTLKFKISHLLDKPIGESETYKFKGPAKFEDFKAKSDISGKVEIMKIKNGFNIVVYNAEIEVQCECEKCLKPIIETIETEKFERQFYINEPSIAQDPADLFMVETKHMTIDLKEALRQEIILHFPPNLVCSTSCKGICPKCWKDRNTEKCNCKIGLEDIDQTKPLAALKKLLK